MRDIDPAQMVAAGRGSGAKRPHGTTGDLFAAAPDEAGSAPLAADDYRQAEAAGAARILPVHDPPPGADQRSSAWRDAALAHPVRHGGLALAPDTDWPPWHRFPRGRLRRRLPHDVLEWLAAEGFALGANEGLEAALRRRCVSAPATASADSLCSGCAPCSAPAQPGRGAAGPCAMLIHRDGVLAAHSAHLRATAVDALCRRHLLHAQPARTAAARN